MNKNARMEALKKAGVNTDKYFTVDLDNGTTIHLIIDENGNPQVVNKPVNDDPILEEIIEDGYVRNTKLHRRWVMAQMFHMLNYVSYDGQYRGYTDCLNRLYGYDYSLKMMLEEVRVLSKLEARDRESFEERSHFFTKTVVVMVVDDYLRKLKQYIEKLPNHKCKGVPYKKVKGVNIFNDDLDKKLYAPVRNYIVRLRCARNYDEMYDILSAFMKNVIKLPYETQKCKAWVEAFKGEGAYYTLKNLVMFHNCTITSAEDIDYGVNSMAYLRTRLDAYRGEGYRMFALMNKVIADNGINTKTHIREVCNQ